SLYGRPSSSASQTMRSDCETPRWWMVIMGRLPPSDDARFAQRLQFLALDTQQGTVDFLVVRPERGARPRDFAGRFGQLREDVLHPQVLELRMLHAQQRFSGLVVLVLQHVGRAVDLASWNAAGVQ